MVGFLFGGNTGETAESLASKRQLAQAMLQRAMGGEKIESPWQGVSEMARALMGGLMQRQMANEGATQNAQLTAALMGQPYAPAADGGDFRDKAANWLFGNSSTPGQSDQTGGTFGRYLTGQGGNQTSPAVNAVPTPSAVQNGGGVSPVSSSANPDVLNYLRQAAQARGIDPDIAVKAFGHEGLNSFDPSKPDAGGDGGSSFGPTQLHYAGLNPDMPNAGLGDEFTKTTGLNARDPSTWQKQVDFSLDQVRKGGWGPWMGAKAEGITGMMGVGDLPQGQTQVASAAPSSAAAYAPAAVMPNSASSAIEQQMAKNPGWLVYDNTKAIRNQPLNSNLTQALSFLPELGVTAHVFSGGQDAEGPNRTGTHRHDGGGSGDMFFMKDGRKLDWNNPEDVPIYQEIVRRAKANGVTGFGAGPGYMQPGSMHVGFGDPAVWGANGSGDNTPDWLRQAYNGQTNGPASAPSAASAFTAQPQASPAASAITAQAPQMAQSFQTPAQMDENYFPPAPQPPTQSASPAQGTQSPRLAAAIAAMSSPYASANVKGLAQAMIQQELSPQNDFQTTPDGNILMINKRTGAVQPIYKAAKPPQWGQINSAGDMGWIDPVNHSISDAAGNPVTPGSQTGIKPTDEMRNFQFAKQNGYQGSFNDWELEQKKAGAQSVTIAGETEESKALGKARADNIVEYMNGGKAARDKLQALQIMEGALAAPGGTDFSTGPGAEMALKAKQALSNITGQSLDGVTNAELFKKMGAYLASAAAKDLASRPTQFDFKTFLENNPGLDISEQGNRVLINIMKQQAQHQMDLARMAQSYKGNSADWNDIVAEYDKSHPMMNPMTGKPLTPDENLGFPDASNGPKPGDVEGGYRFKGGSPGNPANWEKVQ